MKISHSSKIFAVTITLLLTIIGIIVFRALNIQDDIIKSEQHRFRSFLLSIELFQSSEDLTRMARSYVSTGNPVYKKHYFDILDIRNGKQPRQAHYSTTYWHLAGIGKGPAVAQGETIALQDLMRREGFTEQEFSLLRNSQANSDHLVGMEKQAFAALKGLYDDGHGNFTVHRAPDNDYAVRLLFSDKYFDEKALIMAPIQQFMNMLEKRTNDELISFQSQLRQQIYLALFLIALTLFVVAFNIYHTFRTILHPIGHLLSKVTEIASGNYVARSVIYSKNEIGDLCTNFNEMASSLQTDILRRKEAEESLRRSEEQVRLLLNSTAEAIYGIDLNGNCTFANPACLRMLGYTDKEQLLGKNMHQLIHHSYQDGSPMAVEVCRIYQAFREGKGVHVDDEVLWKADGSSFPVEYWSYPQIENGVVSGAVVASIDITKRKQAEKALKESEDKFRTIFQNSSSAMAIIERDTTISMVNREYCKWGLFEEEDVIGKSWTTQIPPGDLERMQEYNRRRLLDPDSAPDHYEFSFYRKDGEIRNSLMSVAIIPTSQKIVCSFVDITERKRAEESLEKERRRLQQALDEVRTLRGIIPICASCKKIRDDKGYWKQIESYISDHSEAEFSHGICPECTKKLYPELYEKILKNIED